MKIETSRVDQGRRAALPPSVSHDLPPNRTCAFRYASGSPGVMVESESGPDSTGTLLLHAE